MIQTRNGQEPRDPFSIPTRRKLGLSILMWLLLASGCTAPLPFRAASHPPTSIQLGPRPFYLLDRLTDGPLREKLDACRSGPFRSSQFSIGHRGAPLQFPEHSRESYLAAIRMGAGVVECDVTFTRDRELVCRHSQCDLASTTNILQTSLAERCRKPFRPATFDADSRELSLPASATCCTSDLTLAEFKRLEGRMDASNPMASTLSEFLDATPSWRTDLYANGGTLVSHKESIELFRTHGVGMTPELKEPLVEMPFSTGKLTPHPSASGYDQAAFARQLVDVYRDAKVSPHKVALQSFNQDDIRTWLEIAPEYGARAVWLSDHDPGLPPPSQAEFEAFFAEGFRTIAPPISALLRLGPDGDFRPTEFAQNARAAGLEIIAWTAERSGRIRNGHVEAQPGDFYLGPVQSALMNDGDVYRVIDALAHEVGVKAIFSDWPATVTFYANCFGLD